MSASAKSKTYVCVRGIDHPKGRHEPGETYDGPAGSLSWLVEQGYVVEEGSRAHKQLAAQLKKQEA